MPYLVKDYMNRNVATVNVQASVVEASKIMMNGHVGYLIALDRTQPVGIVTERDFVLKVIAKERDPSKIRVSEVMSAPLITIDPDASIEEAVRTMAKHGIRRLPVVRDNEIYGVFTARDLERHFNDYEDSVLRDIIGTVALFPQDDVPVN